jgi:hypothetical protein
MTYFINGSENIHSSVDLEILEALLESDDVTYPWNPVEADCEEFFHNAEAQFAIADLLDEELPTRSQSFYNHLDNLWANTSANQHYNCNTNVGILANLKQSLQSAIAARIPHDLIDRIAEKATEIFNPQQSIGDQLVLCAQSVLPSWDSDDLLVLSRPFAYAMRNSEAQNLESVLNKVGEQEWKNLSEIEQARVSLAVAYYALRQLNNQTKP